MVEQFMEIIKDSPSKFTMFLVKLLGTKHSHTEEEWEMRYYELQNRVYVTYYKDFESGHTVHYE